MGGFDWAGTAAWSEEANTNPGVWINLRGREARGCVDPADYEATRTAVITALEEWRVPASGEPVVRRALRREELHTGPFVDRAPDVCVELALHHGYGLSLVPTPWNEQPDSVRPLSADEWAGGRGRGMNGTHRQNGIWIDAGAHRDEAPINLAQAPLAIADIMGLPWEDGAARGEQETARRDYSEQEDAVVAERLRALGYLE